MDSNAMAMMTYDANKKGIGVTYALWFFFGSFGAHRFYMRRTGSAVFQLLLLVVGWVTVWFGVGFFILLPLYLWLAVDLFLIPGMSRKFNLALAARLSGASTAL